MKPLRFILVIFGVGLAPFAGANLAAAQQFGPDPVAKLRQILKETAAAPQRRERLLHEQATAIVDVGDLRRALGLLEWHDDDPNGDLAGIDRACRTAIAQRLEHDLCGQLQDKDPKHQLAAVNVLAEMSRAAPTVAFKFGFGHSLGIDLAALVRSDSPAIAEAAATVLARLNPDAILASQALTVLMETRETGQHLCAMRAARLLIQSAWAVLPQRRGAAGADATRREIVATTTAVVPLAARGARDDNAEVCRESMAVFAEAASSLQRLVTDPRLHHLDLTLAGGSAPVEKEVDDLLPLIQSLKDQGPTLLRGCESPDAEVRLLARQALEDLAGARQSLMHRAADAGVVLAAATLPSDDAPAPDDKRPVGADLLLDGLRENLAALTAGVYDPDVRARRRAIDVLETLGPAAAPAAPALTRALMDSDRFVRWAAARTLGKIGPAAARTCVADLEKLLTDSDVDVRLAAAGALQRFGPAGQAAIPGLVEALKDRDAEVRRAVLCALRGMGYAALPAAPFLQAALEDPDERVRQLAADLLRQLDAPRARPADGPNPPATSKSTDINKDR